MTKVQQLEIANLKKSARDLEELNKITSAYLLGRESVECSPWVICSKIDKLYELLIEKGYIDKDE